MPNYIDTFQAASAGAGLPPGWTPRFNVPTWSVIDEGGDKLVHMAATSPVALWAASLDSVDADGGRARADILVRCRAGAATTASLMGAFCRGSGVDNASSTAYSCRFYGNDRIRIVKTISGTPTTLETTYHGLTVAGNTFYWMRFRADGTALKAKVWAGAVGDEPASWTTEITDASITAAGYAGFMTAAAGQQFAFSDIAIATNGDVATLTADTTDPVLTSPTGATASATTATGTVTTDEGNGTLYFLATTNSTESAATVVAGGATGGSVTVTSTGSKSVNVSGLTPATGYYLHYVQDDAALNRSARVSSSQFTTSAADSTPPNLSAPTATQSGATTATLGVTTDENNGTLYVVVTTSATPPSATQIRAGQNNSGTAAVFADDQPITSTGAKSFGATGLAPSTTYYTYFHHQDASGNNSTVSAASSFTTAASGVKGVQVQMHSLTTASANLTGLTALWWDATTPHTFGAPTYATNSATTDAAGVLTLDLSGSTSLAIGSPGFLLVYKLDGSDPDDSLEFAGQIDVVDIA